jgi:hypothetical protein
MEKRQLSKELYIIAAIATTGIFLLGLLLGLVIENARTAYVDNKYLQQELDFRSSQLQYEYLNLLEEKENCPAIYETLYTNLEDLEKTRVRIETYSDDATITKEAFELLEREYLLAEVRYWLLANRAKEICDHDIVTLLSFSSDEEECATCDEQSFVLSYMKKELGEKLLIFSFNVKTVDEPMIAILKTAYNITEYPSIVVDDALYAQLHDVNVLMPMVCNEYEETPEACAAWINPQ